MAELAELAQLCWEQTNTKQDPNDPGHSYSDPKPKHLLTLNFPFPWTGLRQTRTLAPGIRIPKLALHEVTGMYVGPTCALFKPAFILKPLHEILHI